MVAGLRSNGGGRARSGSSDAGQRLRDASVAQGPQGPRRRLRPLRPVHLNYRGPDRAQLSRRLEIHGAFRPLKRWRNGIASYHRTFIKEQGTTFDRFGLRNSMKPAAVSTRAVFVTFPG